MDTFSKCQTSLLDILHQNHYKLTRRFKIIKPDQRKLLSDKKYINRQYRIGAVCLMKDTIPAATLSTCHSTDMMFIKNICRNVFIYQNCQLYRKLFIKTNPDIFFYFFNIKSQIFIIIDPGYNCFLRYLVLKSFFTIT